MLLIPVLQLRPFGPQWMWEDDASEMHRGNSENLAGAHHRVGEAACVSRPRRAGEDGRIHAAGEHHILKWFTDDMFLRPHSVFLAVSLINRAKPATTPCKSKAFYIMHVQVDLNRSLLTNNQTPMSDSFQLSGSIWSIYSVPQWRFLSSCVFSSQL